MIDGKKKDPNMMDEPSNKNPQESQSDEGMTEGYQADSGEYSETAGTLGGEAEYEEYGPEFYSDTDIDDEGGAMEQPDPQKSDPKTSSEENDTSIDMSGD